MGLGGFLGERDKGLSLKQEGHRGPKKVPWKVSSVIVWPGKITSADLIKGLITDRSIL